MYLQKQHCDLPEDTCVQVTHGCCQLWHSAYTWTLNNQAQNKLAISRPKMDISILNLIHKERKINVWVRKRGQTSTKAYIYIYIISNVRHRWKGRGKGTSTASKTTNGHRMSPRWDHRTRETSQAVEKRPWQILERHDLADDSAI